MDRLIYLLKLLWYFIKYLIIILLVAAIMIVGFFVAKDTANVYIIVSEGMEMRASTILNLSQIEALDDYCIESCIIYDTELGTSKYDEFFIRDFEYKLKIESLWANPWEDIAYVKAVESVPDIDGEYPVEDEEEEPLELPKWQSARYSITLIRVENAWYISQIAKIEDVADEIEATSQPE